MTCVWGWLWVSVCIVVGLSVVVAGHYGSSGKACVYVFLVLVADNLIGGSEDRERQLRGFKRVRVCCHVGALRDVGLDTTSVACAISRYLL